jgi:hypothetical protein
MVIDEDGRLRGAYSGEGLKYDRSKFFFTRDEAETYLMQLRANPIDPLEGKE